MGKEGRDWSAGCHLSCTPAVWGLPGTTEGPQGPLSSYQGLCSLPRSLDSLGSLSHPSRKPSPHHLSPL